MAARADITQAMIARVLTLRVMLVVPTEVTDFRGAHPAPLTTVSIRIGDQLLALDERGLPDPNLPDPDLRADVVYTFDWTAARADPHADLMVVATSSAVDRTCTIRAADKMTLR